MSTLQDPWHFARPELAQAYLDAFELGLSSARGLFARRRMGKTDFMVHDLLPAATAAGYQTAYVNLWEDADHPGQALTTAIMQAVQPAGLAKLWAGLRTPIQRIKGGGKLHGLEGSLELDLGEKEKAAAPALQAALQAVDKTSKPLLLVIDEAQVLAAHQHQAVAHALRAGLDIRKRQIKVLFAGSSESALREMFSRAAAPFYNWAPLEACPLLGTEFVDATLAQLHRVSKNPLNRDHAIEAFTALNGTPGFFRWYIERYLIYPFQGHELALKHTQTRVHNDNDYAKIWKQLKREDRAVLMLIAQGVQDLFGAPAKARLQTLLAPADAPSYTTKSPLRRLTAPKLQLIARVDHGTYRFEDQEFESWVAARHTID